MRLEIHFEAREEFLQAAQFYEAQVPGLGQRFINEIERCQKALLDTPLIGQPYGRRLRKFTVGDKFPYSIVYAVLAEVLIVLAYAHGSRRPGYWRTRSVR
jgi:toxin ParE1/3/4